MIAFARHALMAVIASMAVGVLFCRNIQGGSHGRGASCGSKTITINIDERNGKTRKEELAKAGSGGHRPRLRSVGSGNS